MNEQEIAEQAWAEGAEAVYRGNNLFDGVFPDNPYTPEVEYTPSLVEMNAVLLSKFTQEEIWRGEKRRDDQFAALERVRVAGELQRLKETLDLGATDIAWYKLEAITECVDAIKRLTG
jgi:hypothetical protein